VLDPDKLATFIEVCPVLCHVTPASNIERIQREGLRPGSEIDVITRDDFFSTRPGHTYLIGLGDVPIVEVGAEPRVFAVDLAALDPTLINPDEDMVAERFPGMVAVSPPHREMNEGVEVHGQRGRRAGWAEATLGFDRSEVTERSLFEGRRIAYRGVVPPEALTLLSTPSPVLAAFEGALSKDLGASVSALPFSRGWRVEVARSQVLARESVCGVLRTVGFDVEVQAGGPDQARATCERLRPVIRRLRQVEGRFAEADAVRAGQAAIEAVQALSGDGPRSDLPTAAEISRSAAAAVNALGCLPVFGRDLARQVALDAYDAALRADEVQLVGDQ
jgi:hypothetical protein